MSKFWNAVFAIFAIIGIAFTMNVASVSMENTRLMQVQYALDALAGQGYVAYADPQGNLTVTGNLDVSGNLTAATGRTATITIASNSASSIAKAQSDYVCDGTNDEVEIQQAIDEVQASTNSIGSIYFSGSDYYLSNTVNISGVDLHLFGDGSVGTFTFRAVDGLANKPMFKITENLGGTITQWDHLSFRGDGAYAAIQVDLQHDIQISNSIFWYAGLYFGNNSTHSGSGNIWLSDNWIEANTTRPGITIDGNANARITENYFYHNTPNVYIYRAGYYDSVNRIEFTGNNVHYSYTDGLVAREVLQGLNIADNIFTGNSQTTNNSSSDIVLDGCQHVSVNNNKFGTIRAANAVKYNIYLSNIDISNSAYLDIKDNDFQYGGKSAINYPTPIIPPVGGFYTAVVAPIGYENDLSVGTNVIKGNRGWVTEISGSANITSGNTAIDISHGLVSTPARIILTPTNNPSNPVTYWYADNRTASIFTINVNADPGASGLQFDWRAVVGEGN